MYRYAMPTIKDHNYIKGTPFSDALFVLYRVQILLMLFCYTAVLRFYYSCIPYFALPFHNEYDLIFCFYKNTILQLFSFCVVPIFC